MNSTISLATKSARPRYSACDRDEAEHDGRGLRDLAPVGPLHALKLGPACAQEACDAIAATQRCARWPLGDCTASTTGAAGTTGTAGRERSLLQQIAAFVGLGLLRGDGLL